MEGEVALDGKTYSTILGRLGASLGAKAWARTRFYDAGPSDAGPSVTPGLSELPLCAEPKEVARDLFKHFSSLSASDLLSDVRRPTLAVLGHQNLRRCPAHEFLQQGDHFIPAWLGS